MAPLLAVHRGRQGGLLMAWVLDRPVAPDIVERARQHGLLVNAARPSIVRLMPSLRISSEEIAMALGLLRQAAEEVFARAESAC